MCTATAQNSFKKKKRVLLYARFAELQLHGGGEVHEAETPGEEAQMQSPQGCGKNKWLTPSGPKRHRAVS